MKMRLFLSLCIMWAFVGLSAQGYQRTCYFGFSFEISSNPRWGYGEPVITSVEPYSNAAKAGLKAGDILMEVNGKATYLRHHELIDSWIFEDTSREVSFTIRNTNNTFKEVRVSRYCRGIDEIDEEELAEWFSLYNVEGNNRRHFTIPLQIEAYPEVDFTDYYTYDFIFGGKKPTAIDDYIVHQTEKGLNQKGLRRDVADPDILIQIYYSYEPNSQYVANPAAESQVGAWRYDMDLKRMIKIPVLSPQDGEKVSYVKGRVNFGFQFFEKKYIHPGQMTQIWDSQLTEWIVGDYSLESYCQMHVPLMVSAYPYRIPGKEATFAVDAREYYYTGLRYNRHNLHTIEYVEENSPAFVGGLRQGDRVMQVNGIQFAPSGFDVKNAYTTFVSETMAYRDMSAPFFNDKVNENSYPWYRGYYGKISKEFKKKQYAGGFSYLFAFEPYVDTKPSRELTFFVDRRGQVLMFKVRPEKRKSTNLLNENLKK